MKISILSALLFVMTVFGTVQAQRDTLPMLPDRPIDWSKVKAMAPKFQQKDLVVRIVRLNNLTEVFQYEGNPSWQDDFRFMEVTGDRYIDGVYCGKTKHHKGWHTYFIHGDSALKFPVMMSVPGYVTHLKYDTVGVEMITRRDPGEGEYTTIIHHNYYNHKKAKAISKWELRYISTTQIPAYTSMTFHHLSMQIQLRTSPRDERETAIDYTGDGKPDAAGNVVAEFAQNTPLLRLTEVKEGDLKWSFVLIKGQPLPRSVLTAGDHPDTYFAGWIPSPAIK